MSGGKPVTCTFAFLSSPWSLSFFLPCFWDQWLWGGFFFPLQRFLRISSTMLYVFSRVRHAIIEKPWSAWFSVGNRSKRGKCGSAPTLKTSGGWGWWAGSTSMIGSPVGNQACIVPRLLWDLLLLKLPHPEASKCLLSIFIFLKSRLDLLPLHCKYPPLMYSATPCSLSAKDNHPKQTFA